MKNTPNKIIDIHRLKPEQIQQIQKMIDLFERQNQLDALNKQQEEIDQCDLFDDIFFESEILQPFNRIQLYGDRI
ncbi:MAG: hypothetical protein F6K10_39765 [Moorea sp. SIO2B7]|nr:hypothetical protein [Moorena sp. SIO2B7]